MKAKLGGQRVWQGLRIEDCLRQQRWIKEWAWRTLGSAQKVEIFMLMVRMAAYYQDRPFASAQWYADHSLTSRITVIRLMRQLQALGLLASERRRQVAGRHKNKYGTLALDLRAAIREIRKFLGKGLEAGWRIATGLGRTKVTSGGPSKGIAHYVIGDMRADKEGPDGPETSRWEYVWNAPEVAA